MSGDSEFARKYNTMTDEEWQQGYFNGETPPESETNDTSESEGTDSSHHDSSNSDSEKDDEDKPDEVDKPLTGEFAASAYQAQEDAPPLTDEEESGQSPRPKKNCIHVDLSPQISDNEDTTTKEIEQLQKKQRESTQR